MQAAKESRYDKEAILKFFQTVGVLILSSLEIVLLLLDLNVGLFFFPQLIRRRYVSDDLPSANPWSVSPVQRTSQRLDDDLSDDEQFYKNTRFTHLVFFSTLLANYCQP